MTLPLGRFDTRIRVERQTRRDDTGLGRTGARDWQLFGAFWAAWAPQYGSRAVIDGREEVTTPGVVTLKRSAAGLRIEPGDRIVFLSGPWARRIAAIRSVVPQGPAEIEIVVEEGTPT